MATCATISRAARRSKPPRVRPVLDKVLRAALAAVEPRGAVLNAVALKAESLCVGEGSYRLASFGRALIIGAGKASAPMAVALEEVVGDAFAVEGVVNV